MPERESDGVRTSRGAWSLAGLVAGLAGLATSYFVAMAMTIRDSPVVAVSELVIRFTPGVVAERAIAILGHWDKPVLVLVILLVLGVAVRVGGAAVGPPLVVPPPRLRLPGRGRHAGRRPAVRLLRGQLPAARGRLRDLADRAVPADRAAAAGRARRTPTGASRSRTELVPTRRGFLLRAGLISAAAIARGHRRPGRRSRAAPRRGDPAAAEDQRRHRAARARRGRGSGSPGSSPWQTDNDDFYLIHTAIVVPTIEPREWRLRIHGMVDRELEISYAELLERERTEAWVTLNCVSNPVGGNLIGNAWWSGVRLADLLAEAGVRGDADAILQTSEDGWTCGTPLARGDRRPRRDAGRRHERRAAADRPRLPGAHDRAGPLRLRLRVQVAGRHRGDPVLRHRGLLDRQGLGRAGAGQDRLPDRRARLGRRRAGRRAAGRRRGVGAAHRDLGRRGRPSTAATGSRRPSRRRPPWTPGCSGP